MDCECLEKCPSFNDMMKDMPAIADLYKHQYCKTDNSECARFIIFKKLGRDAVPKDLFPNQKDRLKNIEGL